MGTFLSFLLELDHFNNFSPIYLPPTMPIRTRRQQTASIAYGGADKDNQHNKKPTKKGKQSLTGKRRQGNERGMNERTQSKRQRQHDSDDLIEDILVLSDNEDDDDEDDMFDSDEEENNSSDGSDEEERRNNDDDADNYKCRGIIQQQVNGRSNGRGESIVHCTHGSHSCAEINSEEKENSKWCQYYC